MDDTETIQRQARALGDPTRHGIFRYLVDAAAPIDVAKLTGHFGLNHNAIRQHLAKLVDVGLVVESTAASSGPGRPRLVYEINPNAESRWGIQGPYERLAGFLSEIIRTGDSPIEVGRREGLRIGNSAVTTRTTLQRLEATMAREGFQPEVRQRGKRVDIVLRNCPFESTAVVDPDTVCALHRGLAEGLAEAAGGVVVDDLIAKNPTTAACQLKMHIQTAN